VPLFIAFARDDHREVVDARQSLEMAALLPSFFSCDGLLALVQTFSSEDMAVAWLSEPVAAPWVLRMGLDVSASSHCAAVTPSTEARSPDLCNFTCMLSTTGGYVADKSKHLDIVQLLNTLTFLHGEQLLVHSSSTSAAATAWMTRPVLSPWLVQLLARQRSPGRVRAFPEADLVVCLNSDSDLSEDVTSVRATTSVATIKAGVPADVQALAAALPPPPAPKHSILSMQSIKEGMTLPVVVPFVPGLRARAGGNASVEHGAPSTSTRLSCGGLMRRSGVRGAGGLAESHWEGGLAEGVGGARGSAGTFSSLSTRSERGATDVAEVAASTAREAGGPSQRGPRGQRGAWLQRRVSGNGNGASGVGCAIGVASSALSADNPSGAKRNYVAVRHGTGAERAVKRLHSSDAAPYDMDKLAKRLLASSKNIFVSGGGGVGKTRLLHVITSLYRAAHRGSRAGLATVAPTGVAAAIAGGVTLHAFLRLPANCFDFSRTIHDDASRIFQAMSKQTKQRLATTSLLLLDEVSMVSSRMFSVLVYCMEQARVVFPRARTWRMVAFGDFYQLPPVRDTDDDDVIFDVEAGFAFESDAWDKTFGLEVLELKYVWRQEDAEFIDMLSKLRVGVVSKELSNLMAARMDKYKEAVKAGGLDNMVTHVLPRKKEVNEHNEMCLKALEASTGTERVLYTAIDQALGVDFSDLVLERTLDKALMAPRYLPLCVGARVAMADGSLQHKGVFNGTTGVVVRFDRWETPTFPQACFQSVPVVRFDTVAGRKVDLMVPPTTMSVESVLRDGPYAQRDQLPLMLAWGVTVHRVQGLSLDCAVLDLGASFAPGMVYVALSRVRTTEGLFIKSFAPSKVMVDVTVASFYDSRVSLVRFVDDFVDKD